MKLNIEKIIEYGKSYLCRQCSLSKEIKHEFHILMLHRTIITKECAVRALDEAIQKVMEKQ